VLATVQQQVAPTLATAWALLLLVVVVMVVLCLLLLLLLAWLSSTLTSFQRAWLVTWHCSG
jgi:hypothetical protein